MQHDHKDIEELLPGYFEGSISEPDRVVIEAWKNLSHSNREIFDQSEKVCRSLRLLSEMEHFNPRKALQQVNRKISQRTSQRWWYIWQRVAAILVIPILITAVWLSLGKNKNHHLAVTPSWQTFSTPPGVKAKFYLPDSTAVWLNSSSSITYPSQFVGDLRTVTATGEIFFDVTTNPDKPFIVSLDKIHIRVLGTRFNIINYPNEGQSEVILQEGKIELCTGTPGALTSLSPINPGERATFDRNNNRINIRHVDTEKYTAWISGKLVFKDDPMDEVVRKLNRWFNVDIEVADPRILEYVYTATFQDESLDQILELLTISAPISYQVIPRNKQGDETFSAKRIILRKR
jgi:ferric-dicitrate binding protein FerR (iron transport regulator)